MRILHELLTQQLPWRLAMSCIKYEGAHAVHISGHDRAPIAMYGSCSLQVRPEIAVRRQMLAQLTMEGDFSSRAGT